jgi:galactokinase
MKDKILSSFIEKYKNTPILICSPGRVNLIGEHTDYNDGFVLPASINKAIYFAIAPNDVGEYRFHAFDYNEDFSTPVTKIEPVNLHWPNYLLGVIAQFVKDGKTIPGFDCLFGGDVPLGAGMSSSAAIECGLAFGINQLFDFGYSKLDLVKFSQKAEHEYAGVQCGIMDQFAVMHGKENHVIKLDCRTLEYDLFPLNMNDHMLVLVNTGVKHSLASSEYNKRRQECEEGVKILKKYDNTINALRDVSLELLNQNKSEITPIVYKRCAYVIEENIRLQNACEALYEDNLNLFGQFMYRSHKGLKEMYEVSCSELDNLVDIAHNVDGVLGSRMMGGGFGGCTINLIERDSVEQFKRSILENYKTPDGEPPQIIEVVIEDGTRQIA